MSLLNRGIAILVGMAALAQLWLWYPQLPAIMPSHFNAQGQVDGEMSKFGFVGLIAAIQVLILPGFYLLGKGLGKLPNQMINLPYRQQWLAPPHREATLARLLDMLLACGWTTSLLMMGIFQLTAEFAVGRRDSISPWADYLMIGYLVLLVVWVCAGMARFIRPPRSGGEDPSLIAEGAQEIG